MNNNKKIFLVSPFVSYIEDNTNSRVLSVFNYLKNISNDITIITTDLIHSKKQYKEIEKKNFNEVWIHVPSYNKNISFKRIYSHIIYALRLRKFLLHLKEFPDVVYCTMPTSTSAYICGKFCKRNNIKFIIDVIDLWPDSLIPLVSLKKILSVVTYPWKWVTIKSYAMADIILGESEKYALEAKKYNMKAQIYPIYLGVDIENIKLQLSKSTVFLDKPENEIWIGYGGNLGDSYDFETLIKSVEMLNGRFLYKLWFIGDGIARTQIEKLIQKRKINAEITGFLSYPNYLKYLSYIDIAINIFKKNTKVVYSYKFNDYVGTKCFILNSLNGETSDMIDIYKNGLNFNFEEKKLENVLLKCVGEWDIYKTWIINNEKLITEKLDKKLIYSQLANLFL